MERLATLRRLALATVCLLAATIVLDGDVLGFDAVEFSLLYALAQRAGRVLARDQLLQMLHGSSEEAFDRSIDVVVSRLRSKIEADARNPRLLKTIRGVGYMLTPTER